jgi:hypothetical protein
MVCAILARKSESPRRFFGRGGEGGQRPQPGRRRETDPEHAGRTAGRKDGRAGRDEISGRDGPGGGGDGPAELLERRRRGVSEELERQVPGLGARP